MAEATFSWFKVASFIGALVLVVIAIAAVALGIGLFINGSEFYGIVSVLSGIVCAVDAVLVYLNYQKKDK